MDESAQRMRSLLGPLAGGSKKAEYLRTIELVDKIWKDKGLYYALAFLYDSGYDHQDIKEMMKLLHPRDGEARDKSRTIAGPKRSNGS